jgi:hypothetical protein
MLNCQCPNDDEIAAVTMDMEPLPLVSNPIGKRKRLEDAKQENDSIIQTFSMCDLPRLMSLPGIAKTIIENGLDYEDVANLRPVCKLLSKVLGTHMQKYFETYKPLQQPHGTKEMTEVDENAHRTFTHTYLNGLLHSYNDEPAVVVDFGHSEMWIWYRYGKIYRTPINGVQRPAVVETSDSGVIYITYFDEEGNELGLREIYQGSLEELFAKLC